VLQLVDGLAWGDTSSEQLRHCTALARARFLRRSVAYGALSTGGGCFYAVLFISSVDVIKSAKGAYLEIRSASKSTARSPSAEDPRDPRDPRRGWQRAPWDPLEPPWVSSPVLEEGGPSLVGRIYLYGGCMVAVWRY
jgi:hypothetical protein